MLEERRGGGKPIAREGGEGEGESCGYVLDVRWEGGVSMEIYDVTQAWLMRQFAGSMVKTYFLHQSLDFRHESIFPVLRRR